MTKITVSKMDCPKYDGDWHDKPLRWEVTGPATELQRFSTKASALRYASIRRRSPDFNTACNQFVRG